MCRLLAPLLLLAALIVVAAPSQATTRSQEARNNTSACDGVNSPGPHCKGGFAGLKSKLSGTFVPRPGNVSPLSVHSLLYPGHTTKLYAHLMPWFTVCSTATTFPRTVGDANGNGQIDADEYVHCPNGHIEVGYNSDDATTVDAQIDDMVARGFDGVVVNWYGKPPADCSATNKCREDATTIKVRDNLAARCPAGNCSVLLSLDIDQGVFTQGPDKCADGSAEPMCIATALKGAFTYANDTYFGSRAYLKDSGRPVVSFFIAESNVIPSGQCTSTSPCDAPLTQVTPDRKCQSSSNCWEAIWRSVRAHRLTVQAIDSSGAVFKRPINITVQ